MALDLNTLLASAVTSSLAAKAQADEAAAQKSATKLAKQVDAAIRGTGQHTLMFASGGVGAVLGGVLVELARHFL